MTAAGATAWLLTASILLVSGLAKLPSRRVEETRAALLAHGFAPAPQTIRTAAVVETLLGTGLLLGRGTVVVVSASLALLLFLAYTLLVLRMLGSGTRSGCGCHGQRGGQTSWRTLLRNLALVTLAGLVVALALQGRHLGDLLGSLEPPTTLLAVLVALVPALVLVGRLVRGSSANPVAGERPPFSIAPLPAEPGDYLRLPVPDAPLRDREGHRLSLRDLCRHAAHLLVVVDGVDVQPTDPAVSRWLAQAESWAPNVVAAVLVTGPDAAEVLERTPSTGYTDHTGAAALMLGAQRAPSVVLLGADGWLAAGPASGPSAVDDLMEAIAAELGAPDGLPGRRRA